MKRWLPLALLFFTGCGSVQQVVKPVPSSASGPREICVIDNPAVRESFLAAYRSALSDQGLTARVLPKGSSVSSCSLTSTYTANWRWDLALYLVYANVKVYENGQLAGEALYDSMRAGANTSKFINANEKVRELTVLLFPK